MNNSLNFLINQSLISIFSLLFSVIADIGYFNITINNNIGTLVASGVNISVRKNNWRNKGWGLNSWNVRYACKDVKIIITPTNGAVTEGSWECKVRMSNDDHYYLDRWNKAHIYEKYGYLVHEILLSSCSTYSTYSPSSIGCRKTTGKF